MLKYIISHSDTKYCDVCNLHTNSMGGLGEGSMYGSELLIALRMFEMFLNKNIVRE